MIDFSEIRDFEQFEDLCEELLAAEGLNPRRLGRGPGQRGKDIIADEKIHGSLSGMGSKVWLVECKFTAASGSIGEKDVPNIYDRVKSHGAHGYLLFTNARLRVNLEEHLHGLEHKSDIGISRWTSLRINETVLLHEQVFRKHFPSSFDRWITGNRSIYINQMLGSKSPLVHIQNYLKFVIEAPTELVSEEDKTRALGEALAVLSGIIDDIDHRIGRITIR